MSSTSTRRRVAAALAVIGAAVVVTACTTPTTPTPDQPVVRGLADFHNHMFADQGFAGRLFTHDTDPTTACKPPMSADPGSFRLAELVRDGLVHDALEQAKSGQCYPTTGNLAGQQVDVDSLKRAVDYGLRLVVVDAVNSEFLCDAVKGGNCPDLWAIDAQLNAAHALEAKLDTAAGGPGQGWFRIVTTPAQAREVVAAGKLAVVLGVEASNAYGGCAIVTGGAVPAIPAVLPIPGNPPETVYRLNCGQVLGSEVPTGVTTLAVARLEHYRALGARHFFLVHNLPGIAGGSALFNPLMHGTINPVQRADGGIFNRVPDMNRVVTAARLPVTSRSCPTSLSTFDGGACNSRGLTWTGTQLARAMASYGAVIDADHLSILSKRDLRGPGGLGDGYPLVSSHSGFNEINPGTGAQHHEGQLSTGEVDALVKWGGAMAPILNQGGPGDLATFPAGDTVVPNTCPGTTETWVQAYRYAVSKLRAGTLATGKPAFVGVGFGSDFDGLAGWPRPRFDGNGQVTGYFAYDEAFVGPPLKTHGGYCYPAFNRTFPASAPPHVTYPFTSPMTGASFGRSTLPWSGRTATYDISFDGVAHVGMVPDFVEELRTMGMSDAELEPLWSGAEAFIRTWEASEAWSSSFGTEQARGVQEACQRSRAQLLDFSGTVREIADRWKLAVQETKGLACDFTSDSDPATATTPTG